MCPFTPGLPQLGKGGGASWFGRILCLATFLLGAQGDLESSMYFDLQGLVPFLLPCDSLVFPWTSSGGMNGSWGSSRPLSSGSFATSI